MAEQIDMFAAPAAPAPAYTCPLHDVAHVCEDCPERLDTDHSGFVHRGDCRGRIPLRTCARCERLVSPGFWNHSDYWHCLACVPMGFRSELGAASSPHATDPKKMIRFT